MSTFAKLGLNSELLTVLADLGYEQPTPVQEESIPLLLKGHDVLAQAQTGTGKTAAFAIPILNNIDLSIKSPQAIILAPTRELAIQIAEAFHAYAKNMSGFHVLPIYGGQDYKTQLKALRRGTHVIVGTPGRVMDHIRRGTLTFDELRTVVLDECDEMLRMGFIEDVQWILQQIPNQHQTALFSATMPVVIRNIVRQYLDKPRTVHIKAKTHTIDTIEQFYTIVNQKNKLEALTRFLEFDEHDGILIFARTKTATIELAEKLAARGYSTAAMNGDIKQSHREKVINQIKKGKIDIVVATEVAARGLDVDRITLVINYDIPHDPESYVHRVGRTGRAGRQGKALLLVTPRERRMLEDIERTINLKLTKVAPPSASEINQKRDDDFANRIHKKLTSQNHDYYREIIEDLCHTYECSAEELAAALYGLALPPKPSIDQRSIQADFENDSRSGKRGRNSSRGNGQNYRDNGRKKKKSKKGKGYEGGRKKNARFAEKRIKKRDKARA